MRFIVEPLPDFGETAVEMYEGIATRIKNQNPALAEIATLFYEREKLVFSTQGLNNPWESLAESTVEYKSKYWPSTRILERTGDLERSLTVPGSVGSIHHIVEAGGDWEMTLGTDVTDYRGKEYAYFHEFEFGWGQVTGKPFRTRPMIDIDEVTASAWAEVITNWIVDGVPRPF